MKCIIRANDVKIIFIRIIIHIWKTYFAQILLLLPPFYSLPTLQDTILEFYTYFLWLVLLRLLMPIVQ